jgi:hypothetical protein
MPVKALTYQRIWPMLLRLATYGAACRFWQVNSASGSGRNSSVGVIVVRALAMCLATALPARAQSSASAPSEADSAAVLSIVVDELLQADAASDPIKPYEWRDPERSSTGHPRIFVRIAKMPFGAWARPSIARLHAWRWRYKGWAIDSMQSKREYSDIPGRSYPVILRVGIRFRGDTAEVRASWDHFKCGIAGGGLRAIFTEGYWLVRSPSGWRHTMISVGAEDALCLWRSDSRATLQPMD